MQTNCPHCSSAIELNDVGVSTEIFCPECHGMIPQGPGGIAETVAMAPDQLPVKTGEDETEAMVDGVDTPFSKNHSGAAPPRDLTSGMQFGDYVIEGEIARGGMGVVFKARQVPLNRPVAIKMILSSHLAGEEQIRRFQSEAESAARLDHPGIVPVYEVGAVADQHYFSMGLVEGGDLRQLVREGPLGGEEAARLVRTIAQAIQYAHSRNIVHRDLKPANVLLDSGGQPKVTDFGLAKNIEKDDGMTATGAVMGTPGYMAPEQASGRSDEIGPLADVYALGGILYFLLTGKPPFQGKSVIETIQNVLQEEATSPRHRNPSVNIDLATICLKCLEKDPLRRYSSAGELAEELSLYLDGRPITARPVGQWERGWRWCKRNPIVAGLGTLVTSLLLAAPFVAWQQLSLRQRAEQLVEDKSQLVGELVEKNTTLEQSLRARDLALDRERSALQRKEEALEETEAAISRYVETVKKAELFKDPRFKDLLKLLLKDALAHYRRFVKEHWDEGDESTRRKLASALQEIGEISSRMGSKQDAMTAIQQAINTQKELMRDYPDDVVYGDLATQHIMLGSLHNELGQYDSALLEYRQAIKYARQLTQEHPSDPGHSSRLADAYVSLGQHYFEVGQIQEAIKALRDSLEIDKRLARDHPKIAIYRTALSFCQLYLAVYLRSTGELEEALAVLQQAISVGEQLVKEDPTDTDARSNLANCHLNVGDIHRERGATSAALKEFRKALAIREKIAQEQPNENRFQSHLALCRNNIASLLESSGKLDEALTEYELTRSILQRLLRDNPSVVSHHSGLAVCHANLGKIYFLKGKMSDAEKAFLQAVATHEQLAGDYPEAPEYRARLAKSYDSLAAFYFRSGRVEESMAQLHHATPVLAQLIRENPEIVESRIDLATNHSNLAACYVKMQQTSKAAKEYLNAISVARQLAEDFPTVARVKMMLIGSMHNLSIAYLNDQKITEALTEYQRYATAIEQLAQENPDALSHNDKFATALFERVKIDVETGKPEKAFSTIQKYLSVREQLARDFSGKQKGKLLNAYRRSVPLLHEIGHPQEAKKIFSRLPEQDEGTRTPVDWRTESYLNNTAHLKCSRRFAKSGASSAEVSASPDTPDDIRFVQTVNVAPDQWYHLSGWIKTSEVHQQKGSKESGESGANISVLGKSEVSKQLVGTNDWTFAGFVFNSGDRKQIHIAARLGFYGGEASGVAWFDDLCLVPVEKPKDFNRQPYQKAKFLTPELKQQNLLANPGFEELTKSLEVERWVCPAHWKFRSYKQRYERLGVSLQQTKSGKISAQLVARPQTPDDIFFVQKVTVEKRRWYHLSGWIKTADVQTAETSAGGANLSILKPSKCSRQLKGVNDWTYVAIVFESGEYETLEIAARLGDFGGASSGVAWFDDLCFIPIEQPQDADAELYQQPNFLTPERKKQNLLKNSGFEVVPGE